jgi:hypothetical protein
MNRIMERHYRRSRNCSSQPIRLIFELFGDLASLGNSKGTAVPVVRNPLRFRSKTSMTAIRKETWELSKNVDDFR